jgi:hypothetical protein
MNSPANLLQVDNQTWLDSAFVYALDSSTIGIAGHKILEWNENACFTEKTQIKNDKER